MIIDVPYKLTVNGVSRGHRTKYDIEHYGVLAAEVFECTSDEAPVALHAEYGGDVTETRWHAGRHWTRSSPVGSGPASRDAFMREPGPGDGWTLSAPDGRSKLEPDGKWAGLYPLDRSDYRSISWDNAEAARIRTQEFAEGLLVVDGVLHHEVDVPIFHVSTLWGVRLRHGRPHTVIRNHDRSRRVSRDLDRPCDFFTAVRSEEMAAYVREWYPSTGVKGFVDVFIPEAVEFPDDRLSLLEHARACLDVLEPGLAAMDERTGVAWFRLKSKVQGLESLSEEAEEPAAGALMELEDALEGMRSAKRNFNGMHDASKIARRGLARWELRPIHLGPAGPWAA